MMTQLFKNVSGVVLLVENLDACLKFYRDVLDLQVIFSDDVSHAFKMQDQDFVLLQVSAAAEQISPAAVAQAGNRMFLCADVEDVDAAYQALTAKGVEYIQPPTDQPWGMRTSYFADPAGNLWEFRRQIPTPQK
ncbi:MAG: VOC family protein [Chloroflexota bacterium]